MLDDYIDVLEVFVKHRYIQTPALKQMFIRWLANVVTTCCTIHKYLAKCIHMYLSMRIGNWKIHSLN